MKKFLALILSVAMIFALVACGSKEGDTPNTDGDTQQTDTPAAPVDIVIATGGTSDIPVAEEAALTAQVLGSEVNVAYHGGKGKLTVHFYSDEQLRAFANLLGQYQNEE